jgi:hypothetical protein
MGTIDEDMKRVVKELRLGYVATVCPDGTPNHGVFLVDFQVATGVGVVERPHLVAPLRRRRWQRVRNRLSCEREAHGR